MQDSKQLELSLKTLTATIFLGIAGDLLLRDVPWGIGFAIYAFVIFATGAYLYRRRPVEFGRGVFLVVPPILLFASMFAWRDSNDLKVLNGICLMLLVGVLALRAKSGKLGIATLIDYPYRLLERWLCFFPDFVELVGLEGQSKLLGQIDVTKKFAAALRGILISAPLLLVFGLLFASSDAVFNHFASSALTLNTDDLVSHLFIGGMCLWICGGFLRRLFLAPAGTQDQAETVGRGFHLGITEITIVLSTLNALFLSFVAIQFRYLFGGSNLVLTTTHLSYADYARQGFFELVVVAFLGLGVLIAGHSVVRKDNARDLRLFAFLALGLVTLIFVVMASALTRMELYVGAYGITRDRLYALAGLLWISLLLAWFCASTLRRRPERFAAGAVATLMLVVFGLNCLNPDALIARVDTSRPAGKIDSGYLLQLSNDAIPHLAALAPKLKGQTRDEINAILYDRRKGIHSGDWRSWNLGTEHARTALAASAGRSER